MDVGLLFKVGIIHTKTMKDTGVNKYIIHKSLVPIEYKNRLKVAVQIRECLNNVKASGALAYNFNQSCIEATQISRTSKLEKTLVLPLYSPAGYSFNSLSAMCKTNPRQLNYNVMKQNNVNIFFSVTNNPSLSSTSLSKSNLSISHQPLSLSKR